MIKKTVFIFILLLIAYVALFNFVKPNLQIAQHQWQENTIKAQNFIYQANQELDANIIIGSSLSCRLINDSLNHYYNLSFSGKSIYDGLSILTHQEKFPKRVFIEINEAFREEDKDFTGSITNPFLYSLRKYIPALRDGMQPMAIIGITFSDLLKRVSGNETCFDTLAHLDNDKLDSEKLFEKTLTIQKEKYNKLPKEKVQKQCIQQLKEYVSYLENKGVQIVFFEMPVHQDLNKLPKAILIRKSIITNFEPNKYQYIKQPDCTEYTTTDGVHLSAKEASRYTSYFSKEASKLLNY